MEKFLDILSTAGTPSGFIGAVILILFWLRKQESGVRSDINGSLQRLTTENAALKAELILEKSSHKTETDQLEATVDELRKTRRESEDREAVWERRALTAEEKLRNAGIL